MNPWSTSIGWYCDGKCILTQLLQLWFPLAHRCHVQWTTQKKIHRQNKVNKIMNFFWKNNVIYFRIHIFGWHNTLTTVCFHRTFVVISAKIINTISVMIYRKNTNCFIQYTIWAAFHVHTHPKWFEIKRWKASEFDICKVSSIGSFLSWTEHTYEYLYYICVWNVCYSTVFYYYLCVLATWFFFWISSTVFNLSDTIFWSTFLTQLKINHDFWPQFPITYLFHWKQKKIMNKITRDTYVIKNER